MLHDTSANAQISNSTTGRPGRQDLRLAHHVCLHTPVARACANATRRIGGLPAACTRLRVSAHVLRKNRKFDRKRCFYKQAATILTGPSCAQFLANKLEISGSNILHAAQLFLK
jgi:hypothetical protein